MRGGAYRKTIQKKKKEKKNKAKKKGRETSEARKTRKTKEARETSEARKDIDARRTREAGNRELRAQERKTRDDGSHWSSETMAEDHSDLLLDFMDDEFPGLGNPLPDFDPQSPCLSRGEDMLAVNDNIVRVEKSSIAPGILNTKHNIGDIFVIKGVNKDKLSVKGDNQWGWHPCIKYDKIGSE